MSLSPRARPLTRALPDVSRKGHESHDAIAAVGAQTHLGDDASPARAGSPSPLGGDNPPARRRDAALLQQELDKTSTQRRDSEVQLQDLHAQLKSLQAKVRDCEQTWEDLAKKETKLQREVDAQQQQDEEEGLEAEDGDSQGVPGRDLWRTSPRKSEPVCFNLQDLQESQDGGGRRVSAFFDLDCGPGAALSDGEDDGDIDDWEDGLDALGIAKCRLCGLKLPLDIETIDKHSKECEQAKARASIDKDGASGDASELISGAGRCKRCDELIPLDVDAIEQHSKTCRATSGGSPAGSNDVDDPAKTPTRQRKPRRSSGLGRLVGWGAPKR